jgi:fatty acid desaturase
MHIKQVIHGSLFHLIVIVVVFVIVIVIIIIIVIIIVVVVVVVIVFSDLIYNKSIKHNWSDGI